VAGSGFLTRVIEVETGSVCGSGLRFASRPNHEALGWTVEQSAQFAREFESGFRAWGNNPLECDAGGKMTFGKMQQAAFGCWKTMGEILALTPIIDRPESLTKTKIKLLPPGRLSLANDDMIGMIQGVMSDEWGMPQAYRMRKWDRATLWSEYTDVAARDRDGRPNVLHIFDSSISTTRGISPLAPILKVVRQIDQFADATLTAALIQTIFAATIKTNMTGLAGFEGLMTGEDTLDLVKLAEAQSTWYDASQINLTQHGRIAHLFPNEELDFTESKQNGANFDHFMGWMLREIAAGSGVTYESATGDFRGATYSSIRMGGATEWLGVLRKRANILVPFCEAVKNLYLEEAIYTGRLKLPKGSRFDFMAQKELIGRGTWSGPPQPQADDFKAARSHQVLVDMQATTLKDISESYGRDWEDDARQRAEENRLHDELKLPRPWVPKDLMGTPEGQQAEIKALETPEPAPKPAGAEETDANTTVEEELEADVEEDLGLGD
jgi:lambda family phage portal protein